MTLHAPSAGPSLRLTIHPDEDVLVVPGERVGDLRRRLAVLLVRPELVDAPLCAWAGGGDAVDLDDDHLTGVHPLVPGATLAVRGARPAAVPAQVLGAPAHLAATDGPGSGRLRPATVPGTAPRGRSRAARRGGVRVPRGARRVGRGGRRVPRLGRARWRPGRAVVLPGEPTRTVELRPPPVTASWTYASALVPAGDDARTPPTPAVSLVTTLVPAGGSLVLAVTLHQPMFLLLALLGPLAMLAPRALAAVRRRRDRRTALRPPAVAPPATSPRPADDLLRALVSLHVPTADAVPATGRPDLPEPLAHGLPDGVVAVVGGGARAGAAAIVAHLAATGHALDVVGAGASAWAWCRWLDARAHRAVPAAGAGRRALGPGPDAVPVVVVVDALGDAHALRAPALARVWSQRTAATCLVLVADDARAVPPWCRTVLPVGSLPQVDEDWCETFARTLAGCEHAGTGPRAARAALARAADVAHDGPAGPGRTTGRAAAGRTGADEADDPANARLPGAVALADLVHAPPAPDAAWVRGLWALERTSLATPIGQAAGGTVTIDLVRDGPHALVAGTTGSGKSELLRSLLLGLAVRHPPDRLAIVVVDFKGGTSLGRCATLPHVVGTVSDREPGTAARALDGLRAELGRRARLVADAGVTHVDDLPPGSVPRLLVVMDEFRAVADDLPQFLPGLLRVAAQGRSLGIHLVLATQRPAGAVTADIRANVPLRVALRVVDPVDSADVVDAPHAARIPPVPGRAVLRADDAPLVAFQCARADGARGPRADGVRRADVWAVDAPTEPGVACDLVALVHAAAQDLPAPRPLWAPALPDVVALDDLPREPRAGVTFALTDVPTEQRHGTATWDPADGMLAVLGPARTGRTGTLRAVVRGLLAAGVTVHVLGRPHEFADLGHPLLGTVCGADDPVRAGLVLRHVLDEHTARASAGPVLVIDDLTALAAALDGSTGRAGLLAEVLRRGVPVVLAGDPVPLARWTGRAAHRLVLRSGDRHDDVAAGVPAAFAGHARLPGRGVWLSPGSTPLECQAAHVAVRPDGDHIAVRPDGKPRATAPGRPGTALRIAALPRHVERESFPPLDEPPHEHAVLLGPGGDHAAPLRVATAGGLLVVGRPGSGRSAALATVALGLAELGLLAGVVSRDPLFARIGLPVLDPDRTSDDGRPPSGTAGTDEAVPDVVDLARASSRCVVVDDLDALAVQHLGLVARLAGLWLVAGATVTGALGAHRGPLADLRRRRTGVVLGPAERGVDEIFSAPVEHLLAPDAIAGRGAVVVRGRAERVQVARATTSVRQAGPIEPVEPVGPVETVEPVALVETIEPIASVGRVLHDGAQHETHDHDDGEDEQRHAPERVAGLQRADAQHDLEQLPRHDRCPADPEPTHEAARAGDQERGDGEREDDEADREPDRGLVRQEIDHHGTRADDEGERFDEHDAHDHTDGGRRRRARRAVVGNGGAVVGGHGETRYA
ncbi:S-DNA-T family DNA segregation ATPase FtsK/SpoIIIE [Sediminihabitans luteus]|uniref:S-DNA-T family DNA segregation ATPase FtsK/SpoIIIE n=1 Tax=Sediminihabitans luteus TaxID=1138585 RepID=A0A2M9CDF4_9CELL|nr:FtsK/SpoIIIE domain-containing protein [Sediminihabitans luteus]PJJ69964.1 S-DNA-T family DNA segregation ATPase FtsK/SpoIIIE [Sediminihabitans luteus]GII99284.1 hypothetical protein Slu03_16620 [Sediminihabitans luteus]